ncbi:PhzF family phenazine biosynthesis protein [Caldalkalibacillus salinus]|uniref:PhzF family phenazine biosynthesis protein n=1 Tax=Caldalkalibacillus salinus TaxID=2803787 RepID=UPI001923BD1E|nr:PhzF family phenazine biosynthesis protein [Caldalkalibacillus salinus]
MRLLQVDAFTDKPFGGNPAAVCILNEAQTDDWMQSLAAEMNLSETAFLLEEGEGVYRLRWFTPTTEVDLCGHATLASAHALWEEDLVQGDDEILFHTNSGPLTAERSNGWITLNFPVVGHEEGPVPPQVTEAIGVDPVRVVKSDFDYVVELASEAQVRQLSPDMGMLAELVDHGVIVTSQADDGPFDIVSRVFCPGLGVPEDPVTGSAHCALALYWQQKLNQHEFDAFQASPRGGILKLQLQDDRVQLQGQAVTVLRGSLSHDVGKGA